MAKTSEKSDPKLWEKVKEEVTEGDKGGKPGQWSARKAQLAVGEYKQEGGGYKGEKSEDNSLLQWGKEDWGTKSGEASGKTGERYLPKKSREKLSDAEYKRTTEKKRADTKKGKQFSAQPKDVAKKTAFDRKPGDVSAMTREELMQRAREKGVKGRSGMKKQDLLRALGGVSDGFSEDERRSIQAEYRAVVNMTPAALAKWLESDDSRSVGMTSDGEKVTQAGGGEAVGHHMGERVVAIGHKKQADLVDNDYADMRKVVGYIHRHSKQRPSGDVTDTRWRHSLMNWGHDPLKDK